jgi:integrase
VKDLVFGITDNVQWAWEKARSEADLHGLRFHDLRHTVATRLAKRLQLSEVGRILGHSNPETTYRYTTLTRDMSKRASDVLTDFHNEPAVTPDTSIEAVH